MSDQQLEDLANRVAEDAHSQSTMVRDELAATLAEHQGKGSRNVVVGVVRQRLAFVYALVSWRAADKAHQEILEISYLKLTKRSMYGRAKFGLLHRRLLSFSVGA